MTLFNNLINQLFKRTGKTVGAEFQCFFSITLISLIPYIKLDDPTTVGSEMSIELVMNTITVIVTHVQEGYSLEEIQLSLYDNFIDVSRHGIIQIVLYVQENPFRYQLNDTALEVLTTWIQINTTVEDVIPEISREYLIYVGLGVAFVVSVIGIYYLYKKYYTNSTLEQHPIIEATSGDDGLYSALEDFVSIPLVISVLLMVLIIIWFLRSLSASDFQ